MKKVLIGAILASTLLFSGCDHNDQVNWEAKLKTHYLNTVQTYDISTYNDYCFSNFDVEENEDGTTVLHITIEKSPLSKKAQGMRD